MTYKKWQKSCWLTIWYFVIICFSVTYQKRVCRQLGLCQTSKVCQLLCFFFHFWWCVQVERNVTSSLTVPQNLESSLSGAQHRTAILPNLNFFLIWDIQLLALNRNVFKIIGYSGGWRWLDLKTLGGFC